jgi:hypothetical protein
MRCCGKIVQILMVFLIAWLALPSDDLQAQWMHTKSTGDLEAFKEQLSQQNEGDGTYVAFNLDQYVPGFKPFERTLFPGSYVLMNMNTEKSMEEKRNGLSVQENENYIQLLINGEQNTATAIQNQGKGNFMDLEIYGKDNHGVYFQLGNDNYIFDRIGTPTISQYEVYNEIIQFGTGNAVEKESLQTMPLIIRQRGEGMKLKIGDNPLPE